MATISWISMHTLESCISETRLCLLQRYIYIMLNTIVMWRGLVIGLWWKYLKKRGKESLPKNVCNFFTTYLNIKFSWTYCTVCPWSPVHFYKWIVRKNWQDFLDMKWCIYISYQASRNIQQHVKDFLSWQYNFLQMKPF